MSQHIDPPMMQASVVDDLATNDGTKALSAAQGYALNSNLGSPSSASSVTGADAFSKINTLNDNVSSIYKKYGASVNANLDNLLDTGVGYTSNATSVPSGEGNGTIFVFAMGAFQTYRIAHQFFIPYNSEKLYSRIKLGASWTAWKRIQ